jgi:predicted 2-oxoglutarate/Fe(II)-dependent dioxygenase YbiX
MEYETIKGILTAEECAALIDAAERIGFEPTNESNELRKSHRCILDSSTNLVERIWERIADHVPLRWEDNYEVTGLNPRLRILKYNVGDEFNIHADGTIRTGNGDISKLTLLIYLNVDYEGGYTTYVMGASAKHHVIVPGIGDAVIQDQNILHFVPPITRGKKYVLRTDIMYRNCHAPDEPKTIFIR